MNRLIIADLFSYNNEGVKTGHYFALGRNYIDVFSAIFDVKVAGGPIYKTGFKEDVLCNLPCETRNDEGVFKRFAHIFKNCIHLMNITSPNDVIVIQVAKPATCILALALFGNKRRNIYLIEYDTSVLSNAVKRIVYIIAKRYIKGIICPDESIGKAFNLPYCVVSDYIYTDNPNLDAIQTHEKKYDFVMVGRIEAEKGIVEAAEKLAGCGKSVLIAGKAPAILAEKLIIIAASCSNIDLRLGFVCDEDYYSYLRMGRYCILNYDDAYANRSSGVVLDAIFNGTPVIGRKCMATQFISDEGLGILYDNIQDFDVNQLLCDVDYMQMQERIISFLDRNMRYKESLRSFISSI